MFYTRICLCFMPCVFLENLRVFTASTYEWISRHFYSFLTQRKNGLKFPKDQSMFDCFSKLFNLKQRTQRPFDFHFQNRLWLEKRIKIFQKIARYNKLQFWSTRIETLIIEREMVRTTKIRTSKTKKNSENRLSTFWSFVTP